jgi:hypothetical protein
MDTLEKEAEQGAFPCTAHAQQMTPARAHTGEREQRASLLAAPDSLVQNIQAHR